MVDLNGRPGFELPRAAKTSSTPRTITLELVATIALTISLVIAATAVSIGDWSLRTGAAIATPQSASSPPADEEMPIGG